MGTAIVAIPRLGDPVYKVSTEKVPHMTLLFLGDQANSPRLSEMVGFLEHACTTLSPFGMQVARRGLLGSDNADVLFMDKEYNLKKILDLRAALLHNDAIFAAHQSVEQFDGFTPHVTLGYPKSPAKDDKVDYPITWISFDRIAIWTGNYEGPTFELQEDWNSLEVVSMSETTEKVLEHFGTKGMKWGIRKSKIAKVDVSSSDAARAKAAQDVIKKHGTKALDNKDLQHLVTRMNLERQYTNLHAQEPTKIKKGKNFAKGLLNGAKATQDLYNLANGPMAKAVRVELKKHNAKTK